MNVELIDNALAVTVRGNIRSHGSESLTYQKPFDPGLLVASDISTFIDHPQWLRVSRQRHQRPSAFIWTFVHGICPSSLISFHLSFSLGSSRLLRFRSRVLPVCVVV